MQRELHHAANVKIAFLLPIPDGPARKVAYDVFYPAPMDGWVLTPRNINFPSTNVSFWRNYNVYYSTTGRFHKKSVQHMISNTRLVWEGER
jgi:hypothetical protein